MNDAYSVVIPAYNAERTLAAAIDSVLAQSHPPTAILVIDDGSTDKTSQIAGAYEQAVSLIRQRHAGPGAATTLGLNAVQTPLWAGLDADDLWLPDKAARQIGHLRASPSLDAVFGRTRLFKHGEHPRADAPEQENWGRSTIMMRLAAARRIGPMVDPPEGTCGEMVDWLSRARELRIALEMMPEVVALRRIIPGSLTYKSATAEVGYLHAVKAALLRRRSHQN